MIQIRGGGLEWGGSAGGGFLRSPPPPAAAPDPPSCCVDYLRPALCPPQPAAVHLDVCCLALGTPRSIFSRQSASVRLNSRVEPSLLPHLPRDPTSEKRRRKWRRLSGTRSPVRAGTSTNRGRRQQVGKRWAIRFCKHWFSHRCPVNGNQAFCSTLDEHFHLDP